MLLEEIYPDKTPKKIGISSLFMAAANTKLSASASAIADNVIFCWRDRVNDKNDIPDDFINGIFRNDPLLIKKLTN